MEKGTIKNYWKELINQPQGIIFSDLDGVWFDENSNFSTPPLENLSSLKAAQNNGFLIVLTSDTGAEGLFKYTEELGIESPLVIAEGGICIQSKSGAIEVLVEPATRGIIKKLRADFIKRCENTQGIDFFIGDATSLIRKGFLDYASTKDDYPFLAINAVRTYSLGVYSRRVKQGKLLVDENLTDETYEALAQMTSGCPNLQIKKYPQLGSCLVRPYPRPDKATAVERLLELTSYQGPCFMIGNEIADSMKKTSGRVVTCAVGNADAGLKQQADFVAPENFTVSYGADFIVRKIISNNL